VAAVLVGHGAQKLFGLWGGAGLDGTAAHFALLGLSPPAVLALAFGVMELAGGVLLVLGAYTSWVAPILVLDPVFFVWKVHIYNGFFINWALAPDVGHGIEFHVLLMACLISLSFTGAGTFSVDAWRRRSAEAAAAGLARIRAGKV